MKRPLVSSLHPQLGRQDGEHVDGSGIWFESIC